MIKEIILLLLSLFFLVKSAEYATRFSSKIAKSFRLSEFIVSFFIVAVLSTDNVGKGKVVPGDGAAYYETTFKLVAYRPELQEVVLGKITDISDFGAFMEIGPLDGMVHISQAMDDFVSFSKSNVLTGKQTKRSLKVGDLCRARIIAVSYKDVHNPKVGLTMRQPQLGKLEWIKEDSNKKGASAEKSDKADKPEKKEKSK